MTPFDTASGSYSPWLALLLGALTFASWLGLGTTALAVLRLTPARPWRPLVAVAAGALLLGGAVEALALLGLASRDALFGVFAVGLGVGGWTLAGLWRRPTLSLGSLDLRAIYYALPPLICAGAALLVAIAPSDTDTALSGHALATRRIVEDGAWLFYRFPFDIVLPATLLPAFAAAPLQALGQLDAADVAELGIWFTFLFSFAARFVDRGDHDASWRWLAVAALGSSLVAVEWYSNGGGRALGDAALAALACYLAAPPDGERPRDQAATIAVLGAAAATASLPHAPVALLAVGLGAWRLRRHGLALSLVTLLPTLALALPALWATARWTGSPLGPWLGSPLGATAWTSEDLARGLAFATDGARYSAGIIALFTFGFTNLLVWGGALGYLAMGRGRATVVALLAFQGAMVALWLPVEPRSLCGLHYAAALLFALDAPQRLHDALVREKVTGWIALLLLGPWTVLGAAHASDYAGVATGQEEPSGWYSAHVPLHDAWTGLDSALPEDAALLLWEPWIARKLGAAYAPRPLYLHADDVPADLQRPLYFIWLGTHLEAAIRFHVKTLPGRRRTLGEQVWSTEDALWRTHRETQQGRMRVWKLEPAAPPPETSATEAAPQAPPQAAPAP